MIIQCENCQAKFSLDDSMIPEQGRKVRCSKCRHVFLAKQPTTMSPRQQMDSMDMRLEEEVDSLAAEEDVPSPSEEGVQNFEPTVKIDLAEQEEASYDEEEDELYVSEPSAHRKANLRPVVTLAVVAIVLALIIWFGWSQRDRLPFLSALSESPTDNLIIDRAQLVGKWEKNGQIFVMMGTVHNRSKKPRAFIKVRGMLMDKNGKTLEETWAYCGNPMQPQDLSSKDPAEIQKQMANRDGLKGENKLVAPNTSVPFTIVFFQRPEGVESFGAEVAEAVIPESS
jgi:predicted Zn finger-like uncharacterized protein